MEKLLLVTITALMLMSCNTEKQTKNSAANADTTQVNENTQKPDMSQSLPPNTAKVILTIQGTKPGSADSLKEAEATIKEFIQSGSSTPAITRGERFTLKISSDNLRNKLLKVWEDNDSSTLEAIIKYTPTMTMPSENNKQNVWSLIQIN